MRHFINRGAYSPRVAFFLLLQVLFSSAGAASFAYGVDAADWSIASYRVDSGSGVLRHLDHYPAIKYPVALAVHPSKRFLLTVIKTGNRVAVHRIDPVTGKLSQIPQSPFSIKGNSPYSVSIHPSGKFVYIANRWGGVAGFRMDVESGVLTPVSDSLYPAQERTRSVAVHPSGQFVYATNAYANSISAWRIDGKTGELTPVTGSPFSTGESGILTPEIMKIMDAPAEAGGVPYRVAIHPSGRFAYVTNWAGLSLSVFTINETSGELSPVDGSPFATGGRPYAVAVHPSGRFVYTTSWDSEAVWGYEIDTNSGRLTVLPDTPYLTFGQSPISLTFSSSGKRAYVSNFNSNSITVYDVDGNTGNLRVTDKTQTRNQPFGLVLLEDAGNDNEKSLSAGDGPGYLYVRKDDRGQLYIRDAASSGIKAAGTAGQVSMALGMAAVVNHRSRLLYMSHDAGKDGKDSGLAVYRINHETGKLTGMPELVYRLGFVPSDLAIDTGGQFLYAVNRDKQSLGVFEIDQGKGGLLHVPGQLPETGGGSVAIALDPVGRYSFVANSADNTVSVFSHRRVNTPAMYPVNRQDSSYPVGEQPVDLVVNPGGKYLVVANRDSNSLSVLEIHHLNGQLEAVKGSPFASGKSPVAVAFHPNGRFLYAVNEGDSNISVYQLDLLSGMLTEKVSRVSVLPGSMSIRLDAKGRFAYVLTGKNELQKFSVDGDTGQLKRLSIEKTGPVFAVVK